jgi:hypothetical protein
MIDDLPETAPTLGPGTDTDIGEDTAEQLINGDVPDTPTLPDAERTMQTPDDLGGTAGENAGGAG